MAMVNMNSLLNGKDSRWLQLEVCREFQRNKCSRPDTECKFAHPPANVEVQSGRVTACYDSIKGRCNREKPPCKYFHPPQHLKDQLLINGRNHLALKNALLQQMGFTPGQPMVPGQIPTVGKLSTYSTATTQAQITAFANPQSQLGLMATAPYLAGMPQVGNTFSPYFSPGHLMPTMLPADPNNALALVQQNAVAQQKITRTDRIEPPVGLGMAAPLGCIPNPQQSTTDTTNLSILASRKRAHDPTATSSPDELLMMDVKGVGSFYYDNFAFPGMMPFKRAAGDKSGVPVYQPNTATYQQLLQPYVPVSCEYPIHPNAANALTGVNLNKQAPSLPFLVRQAVPTSATSVHQTPQPTLPNPAPTLPTLPPTSIATYPNMSMSNLPNNFHQQHFQHPFLTDLIAASQFSRLQVAPTITTASLTTPTSVPAVLNNNNNEDLLQLQPFKKIKRDV